MPTYLSPGVYVEEVPAATRPIAGVGTAVAGFVGFAPQGPFNQPVLVTNWQQFTSTFGDMVEDYALAKSIYGFFNNGGGRAYVVRISTGADATESPVAELGTKADKKIPALRVKALEAGGPNVSVQVQAAPGGEEGAEPNYTVTIKAGDETETFTGTVGIFLSALVPSWLHLDSMRAPSSLPPRRTCRSTSRQPRSSAIPPSALASQASRPSKRSR